MFFLHRTSNKMDIFSSNKKKWNLAIIFSSCLLIYTLYMAIAFQSAMTKIRYCEVRNQSKTLKRNIFLVETTGREDLHPRQLCAIESAAKYNPDFNVIVYLKNMTLKPTLTLLNDNYNVTYRELNLDEMFQYTELENLIKSGKMQNSKFIVHTSDLVRLMILWKHGGIYLDLDVIVFRSLAKLDDFAIRENEKVAANGVMGFRKKHPVMKIALEIFAETYNPEEFSANGPALITKAIKKFCEEESLEYIPVLDCGVQVYPKRTAYEIYYTERGKFFENDTKSIELSLKRVSKSWMVHLWNYLTAKTVAKIGDNTLLEVLMKEHCPLIYGKLKAQGLENI